jgi:DNA polymerase (family 10)
MDMDWRHWAYAAELGVPCVITPDAHSVEHLEYLKCGIQAARKAGLAAGKVWNTMDLDTIKTALAEARS